MDIRVVVANPRSYVYLDDRRWFNVTRKQDNFGNNHVASREVFRRPTQNDQMDTVCPSYNLWLWGLGSGGELSCPYRDNAMSEVDSVAAMANRYASRNVVSSIDN